MGEAWLLGNMPVYYLLFPNGGGGESSLSVGRDTLRRKLYLLYYRRRERGGQGKDSSRQATEPRLQTFWRTSDILPVSLLLAGLHIHSPSLLWREEGEGKQTTSLPAAILSNSSVPVAHIGSMGTESYTEKREERGEASSFLPTSPHQPWTSLQCLRNPPGLSLWASFPERYTYSLPSQTYGCHLAAQGASVGPIHYLPCHCHPTSLTMPPTPPHFTFKTSPTLREPGGGVLTHTYATTHHTLPGCPHCREESHLPLGG